MISANNCCGCGACENRCPKNAITMGKDLDGFIVPTILKERCVHCDLCERVCPRINDAPVFSENQAYYAAYHKSLDVRLNSSSGGLFTAISDYILDRGGGIVGVQQSDRLETVMTIGATKEERDRFKKSKYVQANTGPIYQNVKKRLEKGQIVLFTGVPCQVSALKLFLGKEYGNLICVDILCHGIPSESVFKDYIHYKEKKKRKSVSKYNFRDRNPELGWKKTVFSAEYNDGTKEIMDSRFDYYFGLFYRNIAHRESCYSCMHKTKWRVGDITLGDFWGVEKIYPQIDTYNGVSLLVVNSHKGAEVLNRISESVSILPCNIVQELPQTMLDNNPVPKNRKAFFAMRRKYGFAFACFIHVFLFRLAMKMNLIKKNYR